MKEPKKNFYCGDEVDYEDKCLEQCENCTNATGVDYGYIEDAALINYKKLYEGEPLTQDVPIDAFINGTKWQQERSYSEEEVNKMFDTLKINSVDNVATIHNVDLFISSWKQEFKKK